MPFGTRRRLDSRRSVALLLRVDFVFVDDVFVGVEAEVPVLDVVLAAWRKGSVVVGVGGAAPAGADPGLLVVEDVDDTGGAASMSSVGGGDATRTTSSTPVSTSPTSAIRTTRVERNIAYTASRSCSDICPDISWGS